jgi:glucose-1-phosphate thymidylyltransferase
VVTKAVIPVRAPSPRGAASLSGAAPQMVPVANRPLLLHAFEAIEAAGVTDAAVVVDEASLPSVKALIEESASATLMRVEVLRQPPTAGLGAALSRVRDFVADDPFLLHLADSLQKNGLEPFVGDADLGEVDARILTCEVASARRLRLVEAPVRPRVEPIRGAVLEAAPADHAGVYAFGGGAIDVAASAAEATDRELEPAALVRALCERGGSVESLPAGRSWRLGHCQEGWLEGNRLALEGTEPDTAGAHLFDTDIQGGVKIHPTAEVRSSVVRGPAVIGPMTRLTDAYVGPYSSIGAGVLIEAAEIENSIILPGASIRYLGGRLEASVIGAHARVFRDFRLPRALRLNVGEGAEVALA